jgi:outer membrane protein TolC
MTHRHTTFIVAHAITTLFMTIAPAVAQTPTSEHRIQELVRIAVQQVVESQQQNQEPPVASDTGVPVDTRSLVSLSLDDVVKLALDRNLTIAVQRLNPPQFDPAIASLRATYWPQVTSLLGSQSTANPPTAGTIGIPNGAASVTSGVTTFNGGYVQNMPWGGGQLGVTINNLKNTTTSTTALYNPAYLPTYSGTFTQPLLRGFAIDPNRQQLLVTKIQRDISDVQLKSTIANTLSSVREAYWTYVYTVQAVEVAQQSLNLASQLVRDNQTRVQIGTMAPLDVVTAQSQQAQARLTLVQAMGTRDNAELALKQLIVSGVDDPNWKMRIEPSDQLDFEAVEVDLEDAVRRALANRTDLAQAKMNLQQNNITFKFLRNQMLPQADLVASYGLAGLGGTQLERLSNNAISAQVIGVVPGGYTNALSSLFANDYPAWSVQVRFSAPVGHVNVANASIAAAKIQLAQTESQVKQIELQITTDITTAVISLRNDVQAARAAQAAQTLAQESYDAEVKKLAVGMSTNYNVIQQLNALNTAKSSYLDAVLNYRNASVELDRLEQTTLNTANVTLLGGAAWGNGAQATGNLTGAPVGSAR